MMLVNKNLSGAEIQGAPNHFSFFGKSLHSPSPPLG
jgi:hypothetical protein